MKNILIQKGIPTISEFEYSTNSKIINIYVVYAYPHTTLFCLQGRRQKNFRGGGATKKTKQEIAKKTEK